MLSSGSRDAEARRAVVLVAHLPHDPGAGGRRPLVDAVGVVGHDVHRTRSSSAAARTRCRRGRRCRSSRRRPRASELAWTTTSSVSPGTTSVSTKPNASVEEGDRGAGVAVVEAGPHGRLGHGADHATVDRRRRVLDEWEPFVGHPRASGWRRRATASPGPCAPGRRTRTRRRSSASVPRSGRTSSRLERSKRSTRASSLGPTPYSAANCSVRWRRLQPTSAASSATPSRPVDGGEPAQRLGRLAAGRRTGCSTRADGRPQQHAVEHGEALGPRGGGVEALEQLAGQPAPDGVERHDRRRPARRPAARTAPRAPAGVTWSWMPCWLPSWRITAPASCASRRPGRRTLVGPWRAVGQHGQLERCVEADDERDVPRRQAHVLARLEPGVVVADVALDVRPQQRERPADVALRDLVGEPGDGHAAQARAGRVALRGASRNGMSRSTDGSRGRPSTCSPMMLCWISSVPPAIDCAGTETSTSATMPSRRPSGPLSMPVGAGEQRVGAGPRAGRPRWPPACRASPPDPGGRPGGAGRLGPAGRPLVGPLQRDAARRSAGGRSGRRCGPSARRPAATRSARPARCGYHAYVAKYSSASAAASSRRPGRRRRRTTGGASWRTSRSWASVVMAMRHPSPASPTRLAAGTRASVRNTSLNEAWPFIWRSGRTSTPGWCIGSTK